MTEALYTNDTALKMIRNIAPGPNFDSESTVCACSLDTGFLFESGGGMGNGVDQFSFSLRPNLMVLFGLMTQIIMGQMLCFLNTA
jgi:hypothetical protein